MFLSKSFHLRCLQPGGAIYTLLGFLWTGDVFWHAAGGRTYRQLRNGNDKDCLRSRCMDSTENLSDFAVLPGAFPSEHLVRRRAMGPLLPWSFFSLEKQEDGGKRSCAKSRWETLLLYIIHAIDGALKPNLLYRGMFRSPPTAGIQFINGISEQQI